MLAKKILKRVDLELFSHVNLDNLKDIHTFNKLFDKNAHKPIVWDSFCRHFLRKYLQVHENVMGDIFKKILISLMNIFSLVFE